MSVPSLKNTATFLVLHCLTVIVHKLSFEQEIAAILTGSTIVFIPKAKLWPLLYKFVFSSDLQNHVIDYPIKLIKYLSNNSSFTKATDPTYFGLIISKCFVKYSTKSDHMILFNMRNFICLPIFPSTGKEKETG